MNFAAKYIRVFLLWMLSTSLYFPANAQSKSSKPNIIFILADDLGWMDITLNWSKYYNTPDSRTFMPLETYTMAEALKTAGYSFELYNLKEDEGENRNLAGQMPGKVKELDKLIVNHVKEVDGIFPVLNPAYSPVAKNTMGIRSHFPLDKYLMY